MDIDAEELSDMHVAEAFDELVRLANEAAERFADGRPLQVLASLSAMEPLKAILIEQCSERWTAAPSEGGQVLSFGYV